ncbi:hypothetical protein LBMAG53_31400 [Planctomycetota bacterium]|nr:hypothetical protein LBMAG53_31400 [Planctomycetota bacterium]
MIPSTDADTSDRDIVISRTFTAPRVLVWAAWTDPAQVGLWWGPNGFTTTIHQIDVRPGGIWIFDMHDPDGTIYPNWIRYVEIDPPRRLVYVHGGDKDQKDVSFNVTVDFTEEHGRTTVTMRHVFPTKQARDEVVERYGAIEGGKQHLANLEAHVSSRNTSATDQTTFRCERAIPASIEQVFAAISQPERLARWWGPKGFTNTFHVYHFTPGGRWSLVMHAPNGHKYPNENIFEEIHAPHRVVVRHDGAHAFRLTIALMPTAKGGTFVTWTQVFDDPEEAKRIAHIVIPANDENLLRLEEEVHQGLVSPL